MDQNIPLSPSDIPDNGTISQFPSGQNVDSANSTVPRTSDSSLPYPADSSVDFTPVQPAVRHHVHSSLSDDSLSEDTGSCHSEVGAVSQNDFRSLTQRLQHATNLAHNVSDNPDTVDNVDNDLRDVANVLHEAAVILQYIRERNHRTRTRQGSLPLTLNWGTDGASPQSILTSWGVSDIDSSDKFPASRIYYDSTTSNITTLPSSSDQGSVTGIQINPSKDGIEREYMRENDKFSVFTKTNNDSDRMRGDATPTPSFDHDQGSLPSVNVNLRYNNSAHEANNDDPHSLTQESTNHHQIASSPIGATSSASTTEITEDPSTLEQPAGAEGGQQTRAATEPELVVNTDPVDYNKMKRVKVLDAEDDLRLSFICTTAKDSKGYVHVGGVKSYKVCIVKLNTDWEVLNKTYLPLKLHYYKDSFALCFTDNDNIILSIRKSVINNPNAYYSPLCVTVIDKDTNTVLKWLTTDKTFDFVSKYVIMPTFDLTTTLSYENGHVVFPRHRLVSKQGILIKMELETGHRVERRSQRKMDKLLRKHWTSMATTSVAYPNTLDNRGNRLFFDDKEGGIRVFSPDCKSYISGWHCSHSNVQALIVNANGDVAYISRYSELVIYKHVL